MDRRSLLKSAMVLASYGLPLSALLGRPARAATTVGAAQPFSYAWLKGQARALASQPFQSHEGTLPESIRQLNWEDYQALQYRPEKSLWRDLDSPFQIRLFHLGLFYKTPVHVFEVADGQAREFAYDPANFKYSGKARLGSLPKDLGYAGFRVQFHTNFDLDVAAFLGASYFRAVGAEKQYGLSARGLALNTGLPGPEEFPSFTSFWLQRPQGANTKLTVYALLDSPSVTGAYVFDIYPGSNLVMDIDAALYPRQEVQRLGIAPLTSMFQTGENDRRMANDWRPEIHDSDGLSMWNGAGEWIWRPLVNPTGVRVSSFVDENPRGFGLLQRDRDFENYQDDGVFYDKRPSLWVEPKGQWGRGAVQLVEIPTADETSDNIVAFWNPEKKLVPGEERLLSYRLHWGAQPPVSPDGLATVCATRTGIGGVIGQPRRYFSWRFAIDFTGGPLRMIGPKAGVKAVITSSSGDIEVPSARPLASINGYRATFDLRPEEGSNEPIDLRVYLKLGSQPLTETWLYQYTPPPVDQRKI